MAKHWSTNPETGEPTCACVGFHCPYAPSWSRRCSPAICDCFIDTYPDSPFDLHPEAFVVGRPEED